MNRQDYDSQAGEQTPLQATNIVETRKFEIKSPAVVVKVKPDRTDLVDTRIIDGIPYLTIRIEDMVEVNGIPVNFPGGCTFGGMDVCAHGSYSSAIRACVFKSYP